jgi:DNA polymerase III alpha subunit (gram-positive type)
LLGGDLLRYQKINGIILDYETESVNGYSARPWQASWIVIKDNQIIEEYDYFPWWEDLQISKKAAEVTRFNFDYYKAKSTPAGEVLDKLEKYLYDPKYAFISYNGLGFDAVIHQVFRRQFGKEPDYSFIPRSLDVLCLARSYKLNIPYDPKRSLLAFQFSMLTQYSRKIKCSLGQLCKDFKIPAEEGQLHDGLFDVKRTWDVFKELIKVVNI